MSVQETPQTSLYETTIENTALEAALEQREKLKAKAAAARRSYSEQHEIVKAQLAELDLGTGAPVRVGRFVVEQRDVAGRAVSFETGPTTSLAIRLLNPTQ